MTNQFPVIELRPNHVQVRHPSGYIVHCPYGLFPIGIAAGDRITVVTEKAADLDRGETIASDPGGSWRDRPPLL